MDYTSYARKGTGFLGGELPFVAQRRERLYPSRT